MSSLPLVCYPGHKLKTSSQVQVLLQERENVAEQMRVDLMESRGSSTNGAFGQCCSCRWVVHRRFEGQEEQHGDLLEARPKFDVGRRRPLCGARLPLSSKVRALPFKARDGLLRVDAVENVGEPVAALLRARFDPR